MRSKEKKKKNVWETTMQTPRSENKEEKVVLQTSEQVFSSSPHQSRYPHCSLWRIPEWSKWLFSEGTATCWEPMKEQVLMTGTAACGDGQIFHCSLWSLSHLSRWPMEDPCWSNFILKDCRASRGPTIVMGKSGNRKEQQRGTVMCWPTTTCSPPSLSHLGQGCREVGSKEVKLSLGKINGLKEEVFPFLSFFFFLNFQI